MVVWGLPNFGSLATVPGQQEVNWVVASSHIKWGDIMI